MKNVAIAMNVDGTSEYPWLESLLNARDGGDDSVAFEVTGLR